MSTNHTLHFRMDYVTETKLPSRQASAGKGVLLSASLKSLCQEAAEPALAETDFPLRLGLS